MGSELTEAATVSSPPSFAGEKLFPPGFRFHPTDEELILYYLKRKTCARSLKLDIIALIDVYKWHPNELPGLSKWKTGDRQWFYFCPRDRKYPNGGRSSRATLHGYWKATGKDRFITCKSRTVGLKKTLVYYEGRAPSGQRTDWVMHEYTLDEEELKRCRHVQDYYTLCKVFKKSGPGPKNGEQYGAPFIEEEWVDDHDYAGIDELLVQNVNNLVNEPKLKSGTMVNGDQESQKSLLALGPSQEVQPDSDLVQPANEPSVITSVEELQPLVVHEDFLELDDLFSPQPAFQNSQLPMLDDDQQFAHFDGFRAFDFHEDLTAFNEMNPFKIQQIQYPSYTSNLVYETENSGFHSYFNGTGSEAVNTRLQAGYDLSTQAPEVTSSTPSGVETPKSDLNQCRKNREDDGSYSWFSSALWAFVESVPTSPASALESSAHVNKTFEQMPGFSKMSNTSECTSTTRRSKRSLRSSNMGTVYFCFLGVLFALLIVCVGTSIDLMGRCIF